MMLRSMTRTGLSALQRGAKHAGAWRAMATHEVFNQTPFYEGYNSFQSNRRLMECVEAFKHPDAPDHRAKLEAFGALCGQVDHLESARLANEYTPTFTPFDRQGRRIDSVTFHPAYHDMLQLASENEVPSLAWTSPHSHLERSALSSMQYQLESGTGCPLTMTYAAYPVLEQANTDGRFDEWLQKLKVAGYDKRDIHISQKSSVMLGMSMTEKQGGSDVRANTTTAVPSSSGVAGEYELTGHKWFTSAPMCDAFLTLAQTASGLSCFLVPRWASPEQRNVGLQFQRLKSKVGDRSNASSEVEYRGAVGYLVGDEGRGVRTIIEMVHHTRLDCLNGSAALMQIAVSHACHHAAHRSAFGKLLRDQPLMQAVLSDLALESEAAVALGSRIASSFDRSNEEAFRRIAVAVAKYHVCKRTPQVVYESLECLGGNGFVDESPMARFYKQAPLNAVWEGSGNVIVLDVFRALAKEPEALPALLTEIHAVGDSRLDRSCAAVQSIVREGNPMAGRRLVEHLAVLLSAAALSRCGPIEIYDAYVSSRLGSVDETGFPVRSGHFGAIPANAILPHLIDRHLPVFSD